MNYLKLTIIGIILAIFTSCSLIESLSDAKDIKTFNILSDTNNALTSNVIGDIKDTDITLNVPANTDVTQLITSFTISGDIVKVNDISQVSVETKNDFSFPINYMVIAEDGSSKNYTVSVIVEADTAKEITSFSFLAEDNNSLTSDIVGVISESNIALDVPFDLNITQLKASFSISGISVKVNNIAQCNSVTVNDFTEPVIYIVVAEDGNTKEYTVTVEKFKATGLYPEDGSVTAGTTMTLSWDSVSSAVSYEIQMATTVDLVADATVLTVNTNSINPEFPPAGFFWYWRVRALDDNGAITDWSDITSITVNWSNVPASLIGPATDFETEDTTPELSWNEIVGAEYYELQLSTSMEDLATITPIIATSTNYIPELPFDNNTTFYWRIRGVSEDSTTDEITYTAYSIYRIFTVSWGLAGPADGIMFVEELALLSGTAFLDGDYILATDLDLSEFGNWIPIGQRYGEYNTAPFTGTFDGAGYTISGLTMDGETASYNQSGLFGCITNATISNVNLVNVSIIGIGDVGSLVGRSEVNTIIDNCTSDGYIESNNGYAYAGGLIGQCIYFKSTSGDISITNSSSSCTVNGKLSAGGLVGMIYRSILSSSWSPASLVFTGNNTSGNVSGENNTGGLVGYINITQSFTSNFSASYATGTVTGGTSGGLIGYSAGLVPIIDCYATGDVTGSGTYTGGLIGYTTADVSLCYSTGNVSGVTNVGGLLGTTMDFTNTTLCYSTGNVTGSSTSVGGLIGSASQSSYTSTTPEIANCYALGSVQGTDIVGGFIGHGGAIISNCYSVGAVTAIEGTSIGGLAGQVNDVTTSYYNRDTSGQSDTDKGIPLFTTEMKTLETYINAGWDFVDETDNGEVDIWNIDSTYVINNGYPYLTNNLPQ